MNKLKEEIIRLKAEITASQKKRAHSREMDILMEHHGGHSPDDHFRDSTFLYIRSFDGDEGDRPIPADTEFWNSPDVELFEGDILIAANELKVGKVYKVEVTVTNAGDLSANTCTVDLFICDPALALNMANAKPLGIKSVEVPPHGKTKITFKFEADASHIGHSCLFARAYNAVSKDLPVDADWFDTPGDRHIAQQNLSIVKQGEAFMMELIPSKSGQVQISIRSHSAGSKRMKKFRFAKDTQFRDPKTLEKFEILHSPSRQPINEDTVKQLIASKRAKRPSSGSSSRVSSSADSSRPAGDLKPLAEVKQDRWKFESTSRDIGKPVKAILNIPHLALLPREAAVYMIEMRDAKNKITGGITLVIQG